MTSRIAAIGTATLAVGLIVGYFANSIIKDLSTNSSMDMLREPLYWVAPMDPDYRRDEPGKSPMGMDLVPVYSTDDTNDDFVHITPAVVNNLGVRTGLSLTETLRPVIHSVGYVTYNEDETSHIHSRADGWVEKLHVRSEGELVSEGDLLFEFFSPSISNAVFEHVRELKRKDAIGIDATRHKLLSLGVSPKQIKSIGPTTNFEERIHVYAPRSGVVTELSALEGMYLTPNMRALSLTDLSTVWIVAEVFESQAGQIYSGMQTEVTLTHRPELSWSGIVEYIYPELDPITRTVQLRLRLKNQHHILRPNMIVDIVLFGRPIENAVVVPEEAVIRTGMNERVIVALGGGRFQPRVVKTGASVGNKVQILQGLEDQIDVVLSANFLIDSESSITAGFQRLEEPSAGSLHDHATVSKNETHGIVYTHGRINSIDTVTRVVNLSHGLIAEIGWPPMTMDLEVEAEIDFKSFEIGQQVKFGLHRGEEGIYVIVELVHEDGSMEIQQ